MFIPFLPGPLNPFQCQIVLFAFFFTIIFKFTKQKINALITAPPIVNNTDAIYYHLHVNVFDIAFVLLTSHAPCGLVFFVFVIFCRLTKNEKQSSIKSVMVCSSSLRIFNKHFLVQYRLLMLSHKAIFYQLIWALHCFMGSSTEFWCFNFCQGQLYVICLCCLLKAGCYTLPSFLCLCLNYVEAFKCLHLLQNLLLIIHNLDALVPINISTN